MLDNKRLDKDIWFMGIAQSVAKRSACLSRQVGCILVDKHDHIVAATYNGPPSGVEHCRQCHRKESGRDLYDCSAVHAEMNALLQCPDVNKIVTAYVTINPCMICARLLANTSCQTVVFDEVYTNQSYADFTRFWGQRLDRKIVYLRGVLKK